MIKGLSVETTRPLPAAKPQQKTERQESNFADQLLGAKSERPENLNRNDRKNPGRDSNREGTRSVEREKDSKSPSDLKISRGKRDERHERREDDDDDQRDRVSARSASGAVPPMSHPIPTARAPASMPSTDDDAPIVIENPKGSDSDELKLPDFFSKAALKQDGKAIASKDTVEPVNVDDAVTREAAMEKFVAKMQNELGIPPEKILEAFAQLDENALQAPPEKSMGQFMKALDLTPKQEARASALYAELLGNSTGAGQSVNFEVVSPHDASLRKLNASIDDMNNAFFRKGDVSTDAKKAQSAIESMNGEIAKLVREKNEARESVATQSQSAVGASAMMADTVKESIQDSKAVDTSAASATDSNSLLAGLLAAQANPMGSNSATGGGAEGQGQGDLSFLGKSESLAKASGGKTALDSAFAKEMSKELKDEESDLGDGDVKAEAANTIGAKVDPNAIDPTVPATPTAAKAAVANAGEMMLNRQATSQDEEDNIRDLIKEAQVMIKRGGGEMKMEMKPEGMGSVQLRVNVENGKVNVQMLTESESAKHLLERGLSELKSNLVAHELKVQSMSVDVGNDVKNRMDQQATHDHARQRAQQFAAEYMSQMRDDNQGFRQSRLANTGLKQYSRSKSPGDGLAPESVASVASKSRADGSKRLDLVA